MNISIDTGHVQLATAVAISLLLHAAFLAGIDPQTNTAAPPQNPSAAFWVAGGGIRGNDPGTLVQSRALYSPVVFAFPSEFGFSASVMNRTIRSLPPLPARTIPDFSLALEERPVRRDVRSTVGPPEKDIADRFRQPLPPDLVVPGPKQSPAQKMRLRVFLEGEGDLSARAPDWDRSAAPRSAWSGWVQVQVDPDGGVLRAGILESAGERPIAAEWLRWVYRHRFEKGERAAQGRIRIQADPRSAEGTP